MSCERARGTYNAMRAKFQIEKRVINFVQKMILVFASKLSRKLHKLHKSEVRLLSMGYPEATLSLYVKHVRGCV